MNVLISGSSGLVGSALLAELKSVDTYRVMRLIRSGGTTATDAIPWDPAHGQLDVQALGDLDAVVHLGGAGIADRRWSDAYKVEIRESRVRSTRLLSEKLAQLDRRPRVLVCASAVGIYGSRGDELLNETSTLGADFLAEVGRAWEEATRPASERGIRVVNLRLGVVLSAHGGALAKMLTPFKMGVGGRIGDGRQYMSWIALEDVIGVIRHALATDSLSGPVNGVAPHPVTNGEFTKTLGRVLGRPTFFPMPAFAARLVFGEMADALLLSSQRVEPAQLNQTGYQFRFAHLEDALRFHLGRLAARP